jgi:hypothetical protein
MSIQKNKPEFVDSKSPAEIQKLEDQKMLDRVANEAAEQPGKTERRYDEGHDIFTKLKADEKVLARLLLLRAGRYRPSRSAQTSIVFYSTPLC